MEIRNRSVTKVRPGPQYLSMVRSTANKSMKKIERGTNFPERESGVLVLRAISRFILTSILDLAVCEISELGSKNQVL